MAPNKKLSIIAIVLLAGLTQISETIYTPALPAMAHNLNTSNHLAETTLAIYFLGFALGVFYWGRLSDKTGRRPALLIGLCIYTLASLLCGLAVNIYMLLVMRVFQAFGISVGSVITLTMVRETYKDEHRSQVFATVGMALAFTPAIGPFLGGIVSELFGWRANLFLLTLFGLLMGFYVFFSLPETCKVKSKDKEIKTILLSMLKDKHVLGCAWVIGAINGVLFSYYAEAPFIFINNLGLNAAHYGALGIVLASGAIIGGFLFKYYLSRVGARRLNYYGIAIMLVSMALLFLIAYYLPLKQWPRSVSVFLYMLPIFSLILGGMGLLIPHALAHALKNYQQVIGRAGSILGLIYYIWVMLFTSLMAFLHNGSLWMMPAYFFFISLSVVYVVLYVIEYD